MTLNYVFGIHSAKACLEKTPQAVNRLFVLNNRKDKSIQSLVSLAKKAGVSAESLSRQQLDDMSAGANHQGVVLQLSSQKQSYETVDDVLEQLTKPAFILILDGVQDPHNLGACLRSADAAGVDAVVVPKDKAVSITPTVRKVACGAAETVPFFQVTNIARTIESLQQQGIWIYGLAGEAKQTLYDIDFKGSIALVVGAEGKGLRQLTKTKCDDLVSLPMQGYVDSLNVSVATGISLFEVVRQRVGLS